MSSRRPAASSEPQSSSSAFVETERPAIPEVKRENSFYDNFIERAANLKITPDEVKNLVDLQTSLRIVPPIDELNMDQLKVLVKINCPEFANEMTFGNVEEFPIDSALAIYDGKGVGHITCNLRIQEENMYITSLGVLPKFRRHGIAGALLQHAITSIAENTGTANTIFTFIHKDNNDAIRLFNRFGFVRCEKAEEKNASHGVRTYVRPANGCESAPHSPDAVAPSKKFKVARGAERDDLRIGKISEISAKRFKALNQKLFGEDYDAKLHQKVRESPNMSAIVFLDDIPVGSMICEKWETGGLRLLEVMTMGVLDEHKESEEDIKKLFLNHAFKIAEDSQDIHLLTYYVKEDHLVTMTQLAQLGFTFWLPISQFYRQNNHDDVYYIKKTSRMEGKKIVADVAVKIDVQEEQNSMFGLKSFDVEKLNALNHSLVIEDVTQDTVETLKQLNIEISPKSNTDELFKDVLKTSNSSRLALFDSIPVGFIFAERKFNSDGSSHLFIVTMGVKAEKQRHGIAGMLIKHIIQFAQETEDIEFLKTFVKDECEAAARLFERLEFDRFPFSEQFGDYTGSFFCKTIVVEVAEETRIEETQGVQPLDLMFDVKSFDVEKLDALNHSLVIEDVTQDTIETLKELNIEIFPKSNTDELFKNVLKTSNFSRLALFDSIPVGFIFAEKKFNSDGSSHLFIVTMGVKAEKQRHGIAGMLIKHIIQFAQETEDIKFLKTFVKDECEAAARLFERLEFDRFPFPEQFGDYTGSFFCKSTQ